MTAKGAGFHRIQGVRCSSRWTLRAYLGAVRKSVRHIGTRGALVVSLCGSLFGVAGCGQYSPAHAEKASAEGKPSSAEGKPSSKGQVELSHARRQELLAGYELLADTLEDEAKLGKLEFFKKLTLDAPNKAIGKLMNGLSHVSEVRSKELEALRKRSPDLSGKPEQESLIGGAINDIAKDLGKSDMLSRNGGFDVRFVLVQAQATRMVSAISSALARFDPNPERKAWLRKLARDYEDYRADLVKYLGAQAAEYDHPE